MPYGLNVVLVEPEIPVNTGSIGRTCLATGAHLHLIEPLGFEINDTQLKRAGLDYWPHLKVKVNNNLENFLTSIPKNSEMAFFSKKAQTHFYNHQFKKGEYLFFGSETKGLPEHLIRSESSYRIPLYNDKVRSLNQSNAVGIILYEAIRQLGP